MYRESLAVEFHQLLGPFPHRERYAETFAEELFSRYSEPHRHYHNLEHIHTLLRLIDEYEDFLRFPAVLRLAVWYHDAVYSTRSSDNEAASALLAEEHLSRLGAEPALIKRISKLILLTAKHDLKQDEDSDAAFFIDFDLAILAVAPNEYKHYAEQIRSEYSQYPDLLYKPGRRKVLRHFLDKPQIYLQEMLREKWEQQARINLQHELQMLG